MIELEGTRWPETPISWSIKIVVYGVFMHNLISHNQLSSFDDDHDDLLLMMMTKYVIFVNMNTASTFPHRPVWGC